MVKKLRCFVGRTTRKYRSIDIRAMVCSEAATVAMTTKHCFAASFCRCFAFFTLRDQLDPRQKHLLQVEEMLLLRDKLITQGETRKTSTKPCNETMLRNKLKVSFFEKLTRANLFQIERETYTTCLQVYFNTIKVMIKDR